MIKHRRRRWIQSHISLPFPGWRAGNDSVLNEPCGSLPPQIHHYETRGNTKERRTRANCTRIVEKFTHDLDFPFETDRHARSPALGQDRQSDDTGRTSARNESLGGKLRQSACMDRRGVQCNFTPYQSGLTHLWHHPISLFQLIVNSANGWFCDFGFISLQK